MRLDKFEPTAINTMLAEMSEEAHELASSAAAGRELTEKRIAYMRYSGQGHEIAVVLPEPRIGKR